MMKRITELLEIVWINIIKPLKPRLPEDQRYNSFLSFLWLVEHRRKKP